MDCSKAREHMSEALDEKLTDEEKAEFLSHMDNCPECKKQWEQMNQATEILRHQPEKECPEEMVQNVKEEIGKEQMSEKRGKRKQILGMIGICAAVAIVAVGATFLATQGMKQETPLVASQENAAESMENAAAGYMGESGDAADAGTGEAPLASAKMAMSGSTKSSTQEKFNSGEIEIIMPEALLESQMLKELEYDYIEGDALYIKVTKENKNVVNVLMREINIDLIVNAGQTVKFIERKE